MLATPAQHKLERATAASSVVFVTIRKKTNCSDMSESEEESNEGRFEIEESARARATGAQSEDRLGGASSLWLNAMLRCACSYQLAVASQAKELANAPPIRILSNNSLGLSQDRFTTLDRRIETKIRRSCGSDDWRDERAKTENGSGADGLQVGRMTGGGTGDTFRHAAEVESGVQELACTL